jgi:hypothetical protein
MLLSSAVGRGFRARVCHAIKLVRPAFCQSDRLLSGRHPTRTAGANIAPVRQPQVVIIRARETLFNGKSQPTRQLTNL